METYEIPFQPELSSNLAIEDSGATHYSDDDFLDWLTCTNCLQGQCVCPVVINANSLVNENWTAKGHVSTDSQEQKESRLDIVYAYLNADLGEPPLGKKRKLSLSSTSEPSQRKRRRTRISQSARSTLEQCFCSDAYPSYDSIARLSEDTQLPRTCCQELVHKRQDA